MFKDDRKILLESFSKHEVRCWKMCISLLGSSQPVFVIAKANGASQTLIHVVILHMKSG